MSFASPHNRHDRRGAARRSSARGLYIVLAAALAVGTVRADYLKDYWDGREAHRKRKYRESVVFLDRAIQLIELLGSAFRHAASRRFSACACVG